MRLLQLLGYELRHYGTKISTHVYFLIFFSLSLFLMHALGGTFPSVNMAVGGSDGNVHVDSPYVIGTLALVFSLLAVMVTAALAGNAAHRDFDVGMHPLVFTCPVSKPALLGSRYLGTVLINAYVYSGIGAGLWLGCFSPFLDSERVGSFHVSNVLIPYVGFIGPNLLFTSAIFFGLAALTRRMFPNYIGGVLMVIGYLSAGDLASDLDSRHLAVLLDPFGLQGLSELTRYWTAFERNTQPLWPNGWLLQNRALVLSLGAAIFAATTWAMPTNQHGWQRSGRRRRNEASDEDQTESAPIAAVIASPQYGSRAAWTQYRALTSRALRDILGNRYFAAIVGSGLLFLGLNSQVVGDLYGTNTWPVTYQVLEIFGGSFTLFMIIVITFYAGDLVWHEREQKIAQLVDTAPMASWVPFLAKLTALSGTVLALQCVVLVAGIVTQLALGYTHFELGLYLESLFGFRLLDLWLLCVLALAVQVVVNHKYLGHLLMILFYLLGSFRGGLGFEHNLYFFGSDPGLTYSDMNGWGWYPGPYLLYKAYWGAWALSLAVFSSWLWPRGTENGWSARRNRLALRSPGTTATFVAGLAAALLLGGVIFYNTNILQEYQSSRESDAQVAQYERTYKAWEGRPQPRITGVSVEVDLVPETGQVDVRGTLTLRNKTDEAISEIFLRVPQEPVISALDFAWPVSETLRDDEFGVHQLTLARPFPADSTTSLSFDLSYPRLGFPNQGAENSIVENGTFINSKMMIPEFGYDPGAELSRDSQRKRQDLEPKERMAAVDSLEARQNHYVSIDSDWVTFEATVSTSPDQIALAPGYLQKEWTAQHPEHGLRRYFQYEMDAPILNFYAFLSGRYEVARDQWEGVTIEVYHHPEHAYNVDRMIDAVKKSLAYYSVAFSPYQHRQLRIIEFPRYSAFAQAYPNTVPFSESIGFIARLEDPDEDIDYPFYVTAHEVAHQWWAHQVIGGNVQGAQLMSETFAQYSSLMVMEQEYGSEHIRRFLEYELDSYLQGRAAENKKEVPLMLVENQGYIHYRKGSLVMYALKDYLGEEVVNGALSRYLMDVRYQEPPYTNSPEFLDYLREVTPPEEAYLLEDLFETITLYENRALDASATDQGDGRWEVVLNLEARKVRADELGRDEEIEFHDRIDIGVFGKNDEILYLEKHRLTAADSTLTLIVDGKPEEAGIDPWHKLIDRHPDDNRVPVARTPG